jgi:hypothetical protein
MFVLPRIQCPPALSAGDVVALGVSAPPPPPPPMVATDKSTLAIQKSRRASAAAIFAAIRYRASFSSENTSICMAP